MKEFFKVQPLSRTLYTISMIATIGFVLVGYIIFIMVLMDGHDTGRLLISLAASGIIILIYFVARRLIDIYKHLWPLAFYYIFVIYSMLSYDNPTTPNTDGFIYYIIGIAIAFVLAFIPKLQNTESNIPEIQTEDRISKYRTAVQITIIIIITSVAANIFIQDETTIYQAPGTVQEKVNTQTLPTQNYGSYLNNNDIKTKTTTNVKETKKDNTIYIHIPNK